MALEGKIIDHAKSEMPETWRALEKAEYYGAQYLELKANAVMQRLFGSELSETDQQALDGLVIQYAGKVLALDLCTPGIEYWGNAALSISATGRQENKTYIDRANNLRELRKLLIEDTRSMWLDVEPLLVTRVTNKATAANVPSVREVTKAHTPNPYDFEPFYAPKDDSVNG